jgi:hypothetical protein
LKIQIKSVPTRTPGQFWWRVTIGNNTTNYAEYAGAYTYVEKYMKRYYKECSAYAMIQTLAVNMLSVDESKLALKLKRTRCKGITVKQYGYLKGIHERQQRVW